MDGQVGLCELIGYACAWLNGCNDDLSGMTRAAYIWRNGECYCWDKAESNWIPSDCALADSGCCEAAGSASNGTADGSARLQLERTKRNRQRSIIDVRASVIVDPPIGASAFSIEVEIPQGMAVETVSHGGRSDADCRVVRWGPFYGDEPLTVTFAGSRTLTSTRKNARNQPTDSFRGTISFDGVNQPLDVDE